MCIHTHTIQTCMHIFLVIISYIIIFFSSLMYSHLSICMCIYMCVYIYIYIYICVCVCVQIIVCFLFYSNFLNYIFYIFSLSLCTYIIIDLYYQT